MLQCLLNRHHYSLLQLLVLAVVMCLRDKWSIVILLTEYTGCIYLQQRDVRATMVTLTWSRKCNFTLSGNNYLDVMIFKGDTLINLLTYQSSWRAMNHSVLGLLPYTTYGFRIREVQPGSRDGLESQVLSIRTNEAGMQEFFSFHICMYQGFSIHCYFRLFFNATVLKASTSLYGPTLALRGCV